jgi:hypothetical protein
MAFCQAFSGRYQFSADRIGMLKNGVGHMCLVRRETVFPQGDHDRKM